jgi:hypothetical protein
MTVTKPPAHLEDRPPTLADLEGVRRKPRPKDYGKTTTPAQKRHPVRVDNRAVPAA